MSFDFEPMTDEQLEAANIIEEGIYSFEVVKAQRKTSKSGNAMCELQLRIWDKEGKVHFVYDYLVFSKIPLNIKKVSHFCKATGLHEEYKRGSIPEELDLRAGKVSLGIEEPMPNPKGGMYPRKNVVLDYIESNASEAKKKVVDEGFDDMIPF